MLETAHREDQGELPPFKQKAMVDPKSRVPCKDEKMIGTDENSPVQVRHDVCPFINSTTALEQKTYADQVTLVVGASKGIEQEIARFYARAGASLTIVARTQAALDEIRSFILNETAGAQVLAVSVDVKDYIKQSRLRSHGLGSSMF